MDVRLSTATPVPAVHCNTVLVLQGGGALGSYQAGVFEALEKERVAPDWVAGISIGAVNAALIAGNPPERRVARLREFWELVTSGVQMEPIMGRGEPRSWFNETSAMWTAAFGAPGMFSVKLPFTYLFPNGSPDQLGFYDTGPLKETLERLVDFDLLNSKGGVRLSVGAVEIESGNFVYFDNRRHRIGPEHIMASGALPPGFPPIKIGEKFYWDGGIVSNTPLDYVLSENQTDPLLVFQVDLFSARGPLPKSMFEVTEREKDIRYSSRTRFTTDMHLRLHKTKTALRDLLERLPPEFAEDPAAKVLEDLWPERSLAIVQLINRRKEFHSSSSDYEFSRRTMLDHWASGTESVQKSVKKSDWRAIIASRHEAASLDAERPVKTPQ